MSHTNQLKKLIILSEQIVDLMESENSSIENYDFSDYDSVVSQKNLLIKEYETLYKELSSNLDGKNIEVDLDASLMNDLKEHSEKLDNVCARNGELIQSRKDAKEHLLNQMVQEALDQTNKENRYGPQTSNKEKGNAQTVSFVFNKVL